MFNLILLFFLIFGISAAVYAVNINSVVKSVFAMFATFFCVSAILVFTQAEFLAIAHLMIYIGGVIVVMIFAMMLSSKNIIDDKVEIETSISKTKYSKLIAGIFCIALFIAIASLILKSNSTIATNSIRNNTIKDFGEKLLTTYAFQLEIISIVLLIALMAASIITRKEQKNA